MVLACSGAVLVVLSYCQGVESRAGYVIMRVSQYWYGSDHGGQSLSILFANHKANGAVTNIGLSS
mgnify:CR=1 FL=1